MARTTRHRRKRMRRGVQLDLLQRLVQIWDHLHRRQLKILEFRIVRDAHVAGVV